jgi:hypothetical protein
MMLRSSKISAGRLAAIASIKAWTRSRFALDEETPVSVSEIACGLPGCPPLETVVAFWTAPDRRHDFKVFKRLEEVVETDLPPAFMKDAIVWNGEDASCC